MGAKALTVYRGDDRIYDITIKDVDGVVVDITGYTVKFTVKCNANDATSEISKTTVGGGGISLTDPTNGVARITLLNTDTALDKGKYVYDVEVTDLAGRKTTVIKDNFIIKDGIT